MSNVKDRGFTTSNLPSKRKCFCYPSVHELQQRNIAGAQGWGRENPITLTAI